MATIAYALSQPAGFLSKAWISGETAPGPISRSAFAAADELSPNSSIHALTVLPWQTGSRTCQTNTPASAKGNDIQAASLVRRGGARPASPMAINDFIPTKTAEKRFGDAAPWQ